MNAGGVTPASRVIESLSRQDLVCVTPFTVNSMVMDLAMPWMGSPKLALEASMERAPRLTIAATFLVTSAFLPLGRSP